MFHFMLTRCLCPCHALIFKRSLFTNAGYFDETMRSCEDWDMWLRITATGARFKRIDGFFACYRMQPESMTCNYNRMLSHGYRVITKHSHLHKNCQSCIQAAQHGKRNFSYYVWNLTQGPQVNRLYNERSYWRLLCNLVSCSKADKLWLWWGIRRIGRLVRDTVRNHDNKP